METKLENKSKQAFLRGSHHFWVMNDGNRVMSDGNRVMNDENTKNQTTLNLLR